MADDELPDNVTPIGDLIPEEMRGERIKQLPRDQRVEAMRRVRAGRGRSKGRREGLSNDEVDAIKADVKVALAAGKDLGEALAPARTIAALTLVEQAADADKRIAQKAALTIVEYTDGKPVQPIKQDGPIQIVFETAALMPGFNPIELPPGDATFVDE